MSRARPQSVGGRLVPTTRFVLAAIAPLALAFAALFEEQLFWPMLAADAGILLFAAVDALFARRPLIFVERHVPPVLSLDRWAKVTLTLRSVARRTLIVEVTDDVFPAAERNDLPARIRLRRGVNTALTYRIRPRRRGAHALGAHTLRYRSPLGLWLRQQRIPAEDWVKVYPDIRAVAAFELLARKNREMAGVRPTRRRSDVNEFDSLREYQRDDAYRAIDWRATARKGELIVRTYKTEENQSVVFILDGGRLMTAETAGLSFYDHALNATLLLAHVATRSGDNIGLVSYSDAVDAFVAPKRGAKATRQLVEAVFDRYPRLVDANLPAAMRALGARVRQRSLLVLFTQVVDDVSARMLVQAIRSVRRRHLVLCVIFRDEDVERLAHPETSAEDNIALYTQAAAAELLGWRDRLLRDLQAQGALVLDVETRDLTPSLINRYLDIKIRHLL
ncbi:MAG: DUF58 domain-containing protein [Myxococcales bacterium]|nr:DUF58 domain-containing protein [Myxococcales bacterium]